MKSKYYHTKTQQEWDWLFKHFNLVNEDPERNKWLNYGTNMVVRTPSYETNNWSYARKEYYSSRLGITDFIEVSDLMKEEEKHRLSDNFYNEFGSTIESLSANIHQLNRQIVNFNNEMKNRKKEPPFAYELKPQFQTSFNMHDVYLHLNGYTYRGPEYCTAEDWKQVDDDLKVIFDRVEEK